MENKNTKNTNKVTFNTRLDIKVKEMLGQISQADGRNQTAEVEHLIKRRHAELKKEKIIE
jgi:hypothetical protein